MPARRLRRRHPCSSPRIILITSPPVLGLRPSRLLVVKAHFLEAWRRRREPSTANWRNGALGTRVIWTRARLATRRSINGIWEFSIYSRDRLWSVWTTPPTAALICRGLEPVGFPLEIAIFYPRQSATPWWQR